MDFDSAPSLPSASTSSLAADLVQVAVAEVRAAACRNISSEQSDFQKYSRMLEDLRLQWAKEERSRAEELETRLHRHYSGIIEQLQGELDSALSLRSEADRLWLGRALDLDRQRAALLGAIEDKCRESYRTAAQETEVQFVDLATRYDLLLEECENKRVQDKLRYDAKVQGLRTACLRWRADYTRTLHGKYKEVQSAFEASYQKRIDSLQKEVNRLSIDLNSNSKVNIAGLSVGQIQILKYQFEVLNVDPVDQVKILYDILGNLMSVTTHIDLLSDRIKKGGGSARSTQQPKPQSNVKESCLLEIEEVAKSVAKDLDALQLELDSEPFEDEYDKYIAADLLALESTYKLMDTMERAAPAQSLSPGMVQAGSQSQSPISQFKHGIQRQNFNNSSSNNNNHGGGGNFGSPSTAMNVSPIRAFNYNKESPSDWGLRNASPKPRSPPGVPSPVSTAIMPPQPPLTNQLQTQVPRASAPRQATFITNNRRLQRR